MALLSYAQLVRLPNAFTALADVALGVLVTGAWRSAPLSAALLAAASVCLYSSGMVFNDLFDREEDRRDRPFRPLPSGRVSARNAWTLAVVLMGAGWLAAAASGWRADGYRPAPAVLAGLLCAAILLYDAWLKRTPAGPVGMAACRFLNVLLALSAGDGLPDGFKLHLALAVGVYIVGVTWFARTEATESSSSALFGAAVVILAALVVALAVPAHLPAGSGTPAFPYLVVAFGFLVGGPVAKAVDRPTPQRVQAAVKRAVLGLVVFDGVLACGLVGLAGLWVWLLLPPALLLGKWVYST